MSDRNDRQLGQASSDPEALAWVMIFFGGVGLLAYLFAGDAISLFSSSVVVFLVNVAIVADVRIARRKAAEAAVAAYQRDKGRL